MRKLAATISDNICYKLQGDHLCGKQTQISLPQIGTDLVKDPNCYQLRVTMFHDPFR